MKFHFIAGFIASVLFPPACLHCGARIRAGTLCNPCRASFFAAYPAERISRAAGSTGAAMGAVPGVIPGAVTPAVPVIPPPALFCGSCRARLVASGGARENIPGAVRALGRSPCHPSFPYLLGTAGSYRHAVLASLVRALKFEGITDAAEPLSALLIAYAEQCAGFFLAPAHTRHQSIAWGAGGPSSAAAPPIVIPVPLSRRRLLARGFNQAELIARPFAAHFGLALAPHALVRSRHTKPQSEAPSAAARRANVHRCFTVPDPAAIVGRRIVLVDDVATSGATLLEAAQTLRTAGASAILALAAAEA